MNLQEISKLPCDEREAWDGEYPACERSRPNLEASKARQQERRKRAKQEYKDSKERITLDFRGGEFDLACLRSPALKLEKYVEQARERFDTDKFPCILHKGGPWAYLHWTDSSDLIYKCPHDGGYRLTLPQVRASLAYKDVKGKAVNILRDHNAEHMVWRLRLLYEAGSIETTHVPHKLLPEAFSYSQMNANGHKASIVNTYYGLLNLLALKWNVPEWSGNGTTFSLNFGAAWCGLTKDKVRGAMRWLLKNKYIREVDTLKGSFGKPLGVYLPRLR